MLHVRLVYKPTGRLYRRYGTVGVCTLLHHRSVRLRWHSWLQETSRAGGRGAHWLAGALQRSAERCRWSQPSTRRPRQHWWIPQHPRAGQAVQPQTVRPKHHRYTSYCYSNIYFLIFTIATVSVDWLIEHGFTSAPTQYWLYDRRFYRSDDPTNSVKALKEDG